MGGLSIKAWPLVLVLFLMPVYGWAFCTLGADGNYHTDEDPFIDAKNHDFRLKPGSCAVDNGMTLPDVKFDFYGMPRPQGSGYDIGAVEMKQIEPPDGLKLKEEDNSS